MSRTTMLRSSAEMARGPLPNCHDGVGTLGSATVAKREHGAPGCRMKFVHRTVLPPGTSIGIHTHPDDEEYYYVVSGNGKMHLDGEDKPFGPGDISAVYPGGTHGLVNDGEVDLVILVFCMD